MDRKFIEQFANPSSEFRSAPFWAWNDELEPDELRRQIRIMKKMGIGGFFMHSRVGLKTEYLSDRWFECVDACIDEAESLGMKAWLYDEDRWPSGAAGGLVTKNPKYRQKFLHLTRLDKASDYEKPEGLLARFAVTLDGELAVKVRKLSKSGAVKLATGEQLFVFAWQAATCSSWFNHQSYLDTINHDAVAEFIRVTHEEYRKHCGEHFGKAVPGIFTDEPNCGTFFVGMGGDLGDVRIWTTTLAKIFRDRYGFDITDRLVDLYYDVEGGDSQRVRWCFYDCVSFLFSDAFSRQIGQWCDENSLEHTGHVLNEDTVSGQVGQDGSCMRFYEYMQAPGMDMLTQYARQWDTAKQVSSAARQFGKKWRLTETYGCTGWDFPLAGHKALSDWQLALGINIRCQHLAWYSMGGAAKRDYPASIFEHSPWWQNYNVIEDYYARVHAVMTAGEEVRDVLVVHPNESVFMQTHKNIGQDEVCRKINSDTIELRDSLLAANIDFDYGDEDILARHGRVSGTGDGAQLCVAKAPYKVVVVPPVLTLRETTVKLLSRFAAAGGVVVFAGAPPKMVDAFASDKACELAEKCVVTKRCGRPLVEAVENRGRRLDITDADGKRVLNALHLLRQDNDYSYLFVCNTGHHVTGADDVPSYSGHHGELGDVHVSNRDCGFESVTIKLLDGCLGGAVELDATTGDIYDAGAKTTAAGACSITTPFKALDSRMFVIPRTARAAKSLKKLKAPSRLATKTVKTMKLGSAKTPWDITLSEPNVLVLDRPCYKVGNARKFSEPKDILSVDTVVRKALGIEPRGGRMAQPWTYEKKDNYNSITVELKYSFNVKNLPSGQLSLAMERPDKCSHIDINGHALYSDSVNGWWVGRENKTMAVDPAFLCVGENTLSMTVEYDESFSGLEIVYLLGDFGVKVTGGLDCTIISPPEKLKLGDWTRQGLSFYSGNVCYNKRITPKLQNGQRLVVTGGDFEGAALAVLVNGTQAGVIAWPSAEVDITDYFADADSAMLSVQVLGHRRNSHGPLHLSEKRPRWTGSGQFTENDPKWCDKYNLIEVGLMSPPVLEIRK